MQISDEGGESKLSEDLVLSVVNGGRGERCVVTGGEEWRGRLT
jgi:hypothetical protein